MLTKVLYKDRSKKEFNDVLAVHLFPDKNEFEVEFRSETGLPIKTIPLDGVMRVSTYLTVGDVNDPQG